jgi:hypothetical protein
MTDPLPLTTSAQEDDLASLIREIEQIKSALNDPSLSSEAQAEAAREFLNKKAEEIIDLLEELDRWRRAAGESGETGDVVPKGTHRVLVEGFSDESAEAALSAALDKASRYFSELHDVTVTLRQLIELPKGGHRATLEIHVVPMAFKGHPHIQGQDVELKRIHDHEYRNIKKIEADHIKHLVFDHFAAITGKTPSGIPQYYLINVSDSYLMNYMIEKQFFKASRAARQAAIEAAIKGPHQILVRVTPKSGESPEAEPA